MNFEKFVLRDRSKIDGLLKAANQEGEHAPVIEVTLLIVISKFFKRLSLIHTLVPYKNSRYTGSKELSQSSLDRDVMPCKKFLTLY